MADEQCQMENTAEIISNIASAGNSTKCELSKNLELQLSHVLNELSSVRLIVDLLSKERNCVQRESPSDTTVNNQWTQVSYNHQNIPNHQKSLRTLDRNLPQHILETANHFETLTNLPSDTVTHKSENKSVKESSEYTSLRQRKPVYKENSSLRSRQVHRKDSANKIPTLVNGSTSTEVGNKNTRHNFKSNTLSIIDHKIMILGDSHARGPSSNMKSNLDDNYSGCGFVRPGVNIATQISSMTVDINHLMKNDLIIFWGGSNDVSKNNSKEGSKHLVNFVQSNNHTNIFLMCVSPRHDLPEWSCVNNEIKTFN
jgi:hypothetical protein